MITKCLEVRDDGTCIPVLAIKMTPGNVIEHKYLWRCGYPLDGHGVVVMTLRDHRASSDPYDDVWRAGRTMKAAHLFILDNFDRLKEGQVVDVRVILGDQDAPAAPEIWVSPMTGEKGGAASDSKPPMSALRPPP